MLFPKKYDYDAFVSYNKADKDFAEKLVKRIEKENINGEHIKVFFAEWDMLVPTALEKRDLPRKSAFWVRFSPSY